MSSEEIGQYLDAPLFSGLATSDQGGPHVVPFWFEYDGENFRIPTQVKTAKVKHIKKDRRVGMVIDTFTEPFSKFNVKRVMVKGEAELIQDHALLPLRQ